MTNQLKLCCLLDGKPARNIFFVSVDSAYKVFNLRDLIYDKKPAVFAEVKSDDITLWRVSVFVADTTDESPIRLETSNERSKNKLDLFERLSEVFPDTLPERTINVIVELPTSGTSEKDTMSWVCARFPDVHPDDEMPSNTTMEPLSQYSAYETQSRKPSDIGASQMTRIRRKFGKTNGVVRLDEFKLQEVLGEGRSGRVFQAQWRGELVALKTCDLWQNPEYEEEMLAEVAAYKTLAPRQGDCIPRFKIGGYDGGIYAIVTEIVGSPLEVDELSQVERWKVVDKLSLIHTYGILHNDIRMDNILVQHDSNGVQVRFIDFAWSKPASNRREFRKEITKLKMLLGLLASEP
ncbi:hypothetical protein BGZ98_009839 [Dissophora globulifera]|nr:hypothetical protein BGZ98_009839 [Dissophora globulifera]